MARNVNITRGRNHHNDGINFNYGDNINVSARQRHSQRNGKHSSKAITKSHHYTANTAGEKRYPAAAGATSRFSTKSTEPTIELNSKLKRFPRTARLCQPKMIACAPIMQQVTGFTAAAAAMATNNRTRQAAVCASHNERFTARSDNGGGDYDFTTWASILSSDSKTKSLQSTSPGPISSPKKNVSRVVFSEKFNSQIDHLSSPTAEDDLKEPIADVNLSHRLGIIETSRERQTDSGYKSKVNPSISAAVEAALSAMELDQEVCHTDSLLFDPQRVLKFLINELKSRLEEKLLSDDNYICDIIAEMERTIRKMQHKVVEKKRQQQQQPQQATYAEPIVAVKETKRAEVKCFSKSTSPIRCTPPTEKKSVEMKVSISCQTTQTTDNDVLIRCQNCNSVRVKCHEMSHEPKCPEENDVVHTDTELSADDGRLQAKKTIGIGESAEPRREKDQISKRSHISQCPNASKKIDKSCSTNILTESIQRKKSAALANLQDEKLLIMQKYRHLQRQHLKNEMSEIHKMIKHELLRSCNTGKSFEAFKSKLKKSNRVSRTAAAGCKCSQFSSNDLLHLPRLSSSSSQSSSAGTTKTTPETAAATAVPISSSFHKLDDATPIIIVEVKDRGSFCRETNRKDPMVSAFDNEIREKSRATTNRGNKNRVRCRNWDEDAADGRNTEAFLSEVDVNDDGGDIGDVAGVVDGNDNGPDCAPFRNTRYNLPLFQGNNKNKSSKVQYENNRIPRNALKSDESASTTTLDKSRATSLSAIDMPNLSSASFLLELFTSTETTTDTDSISLTFSPI